NYIKPNQLFFHNLAVLLMYGNKKAEDHSPALVLSYLFLLYIKSKMHDIAILHDIFLTFHTHFTGFFHFRLGTVLDKIVIFYYLGTDKSFFKIGMNNARSLRCRPALANSPGANFFYSGSKIRLKMK